MILASSLAMLAAQATGLPVAPKRRARIGAVAGGSPATVESVTQARLDLDCQLTDRKRAWSRIKLRKTGGRGYMRGARIELTPEIVTVVEDAGNVLRGLPFRSASQQSVIFGSLDDTFVRFQAATPLQDYRYVTLEYHSRVNATENAALAMIGFCELTRTPQTPLTETETKALLLQ